MNYSMPKAIFTGALLAVFALPATGVAADKLFVGNLSYETNEGDLQAAFGEYGSVTDAGLATDKMNGRPRGKAFSPVNSNDYTEEELLFLEKMARVDAQKKEKEAKEAKAKEAKRKRAKG